MESSLAKIWEDFVTFFKQLETGKKVGLISIAVLTISVMASMIIWASKTDYKVLYTDLNKEDATKIARILEEKKINYQVSDDGKTVKIPSNQVEAFRMELAKGGVSFSGTVGYEVFDKQSFGASSFVQKINKQRALEGELVKTIKHINGIKRARVHISIPETSPFVAEEKSPTASVLLDVEDGVTIAPAEVKGIQQLVAASVNGMRQEHVFVSDSKGQRLSNNVTDAMSAETANKIDLESKLNRQYEKRVEDILGKVVGTGKVIAKVSAKLDFTEEVATMTTYDNENVAIISEVSNTQQLQGSRPSPQGLSGARSNLPGEAPQPGIPETRNDVNKALVTRNYNVPSKVTHSKSPTAKIQNLSVAVMIDGKEVPVLGENGVPLKDENGMVKTQYAIWSDQEIKNFEEIVASTIGIDPKRGDKIVIKNMEFVKEDFTKADALLAAKERREMFKEMVRYASIVLAILLFFFVVIRPFIKWITQSSVETIEDLLPKTLEELEQVQASQNIPGLEDTPAAFEDKYNHDKVTGNILKEKIIDLVEANPQKAAQVIHEMIHSVPDTQALSGTGGRDIA